VRLRLSIFAVPLIVLCSFFTLILIATPSHAQATRTWVSGVGDDANPCSRTAPCKTFAGAISKTAPSGEINCLDPGGFGALTITKAITIDCTATLAGVLVSGTNGINISAGASDVVTLRNLRIDGLGTSLVGIDFFAGASLHIENCVIMGFRSGAAAGIGFFPSGFSQLFVSNSSISENGSGIAVQPTGSGSGRLIIERVKLENNVRGLVINTAGSSGGGLAVVMRDSVAAGHTNEGIFAIASGSPAITLTLERVAAVANSGAGVAASGANAAIRIGNSTITNNVIGVSNSGGSITSYKNNEINNNLTDGTPLPQQQLN
jgi:hypothetical protein